MIVAFNSSTEETSALISLAVSSVNSGKVFTLTSLTVTTNFASLPANSAAWYSSGKVTNTSFVSPALTPTNCSSKPGMNDPEPISNG